MNDSEAKKLLFRWAEAIPIGGEKWLRAVPALRNYPERHKEEKVGSSPGLKQIGAHGLRTNPDGLYANFFVATDKKKSHSVIEFCDIAVVEVSGSLPNFYDKRSRYAGLGAGLILRSTRGWWRENIEGKGQSKAEWCGLILPDSKNEKVAHPSHNLFRDFMTPVRVSRVLYVLKDKDAKHLQDNNVLAAHEFVINASAFRKWKTHDIRDFISSTSHRHHFLFKSAAS